MPISTSRRPSVKGALIAGVFVLLGVEPAFGQCIVTDPSNTAEAASTATQTASQAGTMAQMTATTGGIASAVGKAGVGQVSGLLGSATSGLNSAAGAISSGANSLASGAASLASKAANGINSVTSAVNSGVTGAMNSIGNALDLGGGSGLSQLATSANNLVKAGGNLYGSTVGAVNTVTSIPGNALSTVESAAGGAINSPVNALNGAGNSAVGKLGQSALGQAAGAATGAYSLASQAGGLGSIVGSASGNLAGLQNASLPSLAALQLPYGIGGAGGTVSLTGLAYTLSAFAPATTATAINGLTAPGMPTAPSANFSTVANAQNWVDGTLYVPSPNAASNAATVATVSPAVAQTIQSRRSIAYTTAVQQGYALALTTRAHEVDDEKRAAAMMQAGNSATDLRGQLAALQVGLTVLQGELSTIRQLRTAELEIQATRAMRRTSVVAVADVPDASTAGAK